MAHCHLQSPRSHDRRRLQKGWQGCKVVGKSMVKTPNQTWNIVISNCFFGCYTLSFFGRSDQRCMFFPWSCDEPLSVKWNTASSHHFIPSLNTPRETRGGPDGRYYRVTPATPWNIGSSMFLAIFWCDLYFISIWYAGFFVTAPKVASFNSLYSLSEENRRDSTEPPIVLQIGPLVLVQISLKKVNEFGVPCPPKSTVICHLLLPFRVIKHGLPEKSPLSSIIYFANKKQQTTFIIFHS